MTGRVFACAFGLALAAAPAFAQTDADPHAAQPERPSVATHAGTVAPGWLEIETGLERDRADGLIGDQIPSLVKIGVARRVQFEAQVPVLTPSGAGTGIGDLAVAVRWRVREQTRVLGDLAVQPSLKWPSGSSANGRGTSTTDAGVLLIASRSLGVVSMDLNVGYTRRSGDGLAAPRNATLWAASFGGPARGRLGWGAELFGYPATAGPAGATSSVAFLGGPIAKVRAWLILDAGVIVPIAGPQASAVFAGGVYNVGRLQGRK
jgi:hypothetical protein